MNTQEYRTTTGVRAMLIWLDRQGKLDRRTAVLFACRCAARTLHLWGKEHPDDKRPRDAIRTALRWWAGRATEAECREAALSAYTASAACAMYATPYYAAAASAHTAAASYSSYSVLTTSAAASAAAAAAASAYASAYVYADASYAACAAACAAAERQWQSDLLRKMVDPRHALERLAEAGRLGNSKSVNKHVSEASSAVPDEGKSVRDTA